MALLDEHGRVLVEIAGLRVMAARSASLLRSLEPNLDDWLYQVRWRPPAVTAGAAPAPDTGRWLILSDAAGLGASVAQRLTERGTSWRLVRRDQLDLDSTQAMMDVLTADQAAAIPGHAIVCLWALDDAPAGDPLESAGTHCGEILRLVQALAQLPEPPRLWLVTRRAQAVLPHEPKVDAGQALRWGLGRTMAIELPDLWGGLIDLDDDQLAAAEALANWVGRSSEDQLALRGGQC